MKKLQYCILLLLALLPHGISAQQLSETYNSQRPVVIVCDWDKAPYEFLNDYGQPAGSNVDVLKTIFKELNIPCRFIMKEWGNAIKTFERGEADLILANTRRYTNNKQYYWTENIINYNRIMAASTRKDSSILTIRKLVEEGVVLKPSDYSVFYFLEEDTANIRRIEQQSPKVSMMGLVAGDYNYFVWGEEPIKWKIKELNMENIYLNEVTIPISEIHIVGRDKMLVDVIDDQYSRIKESGELEQINNRWFHPERITSKTSPTTLYILIGVILLALLLWLAYRISKAQVRNATRQSTELNNMMVKALHMANLEGNTLHNTTDDIERKRDTYEEQKKYEVLSNIPLFATSFYDKDGYLVELNDAMKEICGFKKSADNVERFWRRISMFDMPLIRGSYSPSDRHDLYACQHMLFPDLGIDRYIEFCVHPLINNQGDITNYFVSVFDVTDEHDIYQQIGKIQKEMKKIDEQLKFHDKQLTELIECSNLFLWHSDIPNQTISFYKSLQSHKVLEENLDAFISRIVPGEQDVARYIFNNTDTHQADLNMVLHFSHTVIDETENWFNLKATPIRNEEGAVIGHHGVSYEITETIKLQRELHEVTRRAETRNQQKNAFMASMTHELRTPLNAIMGFTDVLRITDAPEERKEYIRVVRNSCDMLVRLINDIFEASTTAAGPDSIEPAKVDFAKSFDDICLMLTQRVTNPSVTFLKDNPYDTFITTLDMGRIQQIIINFVTNAVKFTTKGHIRVGYRYEDNGLHIYCEDTGSGIPKDKQDVVFERFVKLDEYAQGTGLGLNICKSIAERCGGHIGVNSEGLGHGSTFWVWIPCKQEQVG